MNGTWPFRFTCLGLLILWPCTLRAAILTVHPDGSGPYPTIQAAVDASVSSDIIELSDGTFTGSGNGDIDYLGKAITIRSQGGNAETCVIDCGPSYRGFAFHTGETSSSILEGVSVVNGSASNTDGPDWGGAILCIGSGPTIRNCRFLDNRATETGGAISVYGQPSQPVIMDCYFSRNTTAICSGCDGGGAISIRGGGSARVERCEFTDNWAPGGEILCQDGSSLTLTNSAVFVSIFAAVYCVDASSVTIDGCTLAWVAGDGLVVLESNSTAVIQNAILAFGWGSAKAVHCDGTSTAALSCCDVYGSPGGDYVGCLSGMQGVSGNVSVDPLFCGDESVLLCSDSPCLPAHNSCGVLIGASGEGCAPCGQPTPVERETWGRIKAAYRRR